MVHLSVGYIKLFKYVCFQLFFLVSFPVDQGGDDIDDDDVLEDDIVSWLFAGFLFSLFFLTFLCMCLTKLLMV